MSDLTIDQILIRKANRHERGLFQLREYGLQRAYLAKDGRAAWDFIEGYQAVNSGERPGDEVLVTGLGWAQIGFDDLPEMTLKHACEIVLARTIESEIYDGLSSIDQQLQRKGNEAKFEAREKLLRLADRMREIDSANRTAVEVFSAYPDVLVSYQRYKKGLFGIETPWPTITKHIKGFQRGHVNYFVARPKVGKTWVLLTTCLHLFKEEHQSVLLISPELTKQHAAERISCLDAKVSYELMTDGKLSYEDERRFIDVIKQTQDRRGFLILEKNDGLSKAKIEAAIDMYDPDVIAVDSMYKLGEGRSRNDVIADSANWLTQIVERGRPRIIFATSQMNRNAITAETTTMENIYGSDAIGQDAHLIYGLFSNPEMDNDNQLGWKQLAVRRGKYHPPFYSHFDLMTMNFSEIEGDAYAREDERWDDTDVPY